MFILNRLTDFWCLLARQVSRRILVDHKRKLTQSSERQKPIYKVGQISSTAMLRHLPGQPPGRAAHRALQTGLIWLQQTIQYKHESL